MNNLESGFRFHRGMLKDSLETSVPCTSRKELENILTSDSFHNQIKRSYNEWIYCSEYYGYDKRCKQHLWIVMMGGWVVGFWFNKNKESFLDNVE